MLKRKVLLIASAYFNYYKLIKKKLEEIGMEVDCFVDRPTQNSFFKAVSRIKPSMVYKRVQPYFDSIILKTKDKKYDFVFFIRGMSYCFSDEMMQKLKNTHSEAVFLSYQWDSNLNLKDIESFWHFFDRSYSFDRIDCEKNEALSFLPLFYEDEYKIPFDNKKEYKYDCCYIGTAHPKKYKFIEEMSEKLNEKFKNQFIFHYMPSKLKFYYHKLKNPEYKNARLKDFKREKLSKEETIEIVKNSFCVLDSPQDNQDGATMRVIECLGANKKLITTNKDLVNYDFYNPKNIYIYNGEFDFDNEFFKTDYQPPEKEIYEKYSLESFLKTIFEIKSEV